MITTSTRVEDARLLPYDAARPCPQCGNDRVKTRYEGPIEQDPCWYDRKYRPVGKWPEHPYLHRTCERCEYQWPEASLSQGAGHEQ